MDTPDALNQAIAATVLAICMVMKLPQIYGIMKANTAKGISLKSLLMEFWCFTNLLAYPCANGYPLSAYVEMLALVIQDTVLLLLVLHHMDRLSPATMTGLIAYMTFVWSVAMGYYPTWLLYGLACTVTPIGPSGKLVQVWTIVSRKDAGSVSALSWGLGTFTATVRIFTAVFQAQDRFLAFMSTQAALLNGCVCLCALVYGKQKEKAH